MMTSGVDVDRESRQSCTVRQWRPASPSSVSGPGADGSVNEETSASYLSGLLIGPAPPQCAGDACSSSACLNSVPHGQAIEAWRLFYAHADRCRARGLPPSPGGYRGLKLVVAKMPYCGDLARHKAGGSGIDLYLVGEGWHRHREVPSIHRTRWRASPSYRRPLATACDRSGYVDRSMQSRSGGCGWSAIVTPRGYCDRSRRQNANLFAVPDSSID
jgi:hypothetical protein